VDLEAWVQRGPLLIKQVDGEDGAAGFGG